MLSTCQLVPDPVIVTAYWALPLLAPFEVVRCYVPVATKVRLDGPKARIELITAVPVDTCYWSDLTLATPAASTAFAGCWPAAW